MDPMLIESEPAPGLALLTLNRPAQRNALDAALIVGLRTAIARHAAARATRVLLIAAAGSSFCAGADLHSMQAIGRGPAAENAADALRLAELLLELRVCPKPSIALIQGPAYGGGVGLACACDLALASVEARFRLPEVQLGLAPAVISPYVLEAIGVRQARRYFLSAELISSARALELGLVHEVVAADALANAGIALAQAITAGGPAAVAACKRLIADGAHAAPSPERAAQTARQLAEMRAGAEAQEGIAAALERRPPSWRH